MFRKMLGELGAAPGIEVGLLCAGQTPSLYTLSGPPCKFLGAESPHYLLCLPWMQSCSWQEAETILKL